MVVLIDTNILLRSVEPMHAQHSIAVEAVALLIAEDSQVCFTLQNIAEFWNVSTRSVANNGLGYSIHTAMEEVRKIESILILLPDIPRIYREWKRIIVEHEVSGVKVHDARLVATMRTYGIRRILTFDVDDFKRYSDIEVIHPQAVVTGRSD